MSELEASSGTPAPPARRRPVGGARLFAATAVAVALAIVVGGWLTSAREFMYGAFLAAAVFAFLPFLVVGALVVVLLVTGVVVAAAGGATPDVDLAGIDGASASGGPGSADGHVLDDLPLLGSYYRFLASRRHPVFWAIPAGVLLGGLLLLALVGSLVAPGEARTAEVLAAAQEHVEEHFAEHHRYLEAESDGHIVLPDGDGALLDGFGNPVRYEVTGRWPATSYRLTSNGYDGEPGRDDLCVSGGTGLARALGALSRLRGPGAASPSTVDFLSAARELRCE